MKNGVNSVTKISTEYIKLEQFLKLCEIAGSGGQAKLMIQNGEVQVNGETEVRRGRKLYPGDSVTAVGRTVVVE